MESCSWIPAASASLSIVIVPACDIERLRPAHNTNVFNAPRIGWVESQEKRPVQVI